MKKVTSRVLAVVMGLAMVLDSQVICAFASNYSGEERVIIGESVSDSASIGANKIINDDKENNLEDNAGDYSKDLYDEELPTNAIDDFDALDVIDHNAYYTTNTYKPYEGATYELKYTVLDGGKTVRITGIDGTATDVLVIPRNIDGYTVTEIGYEAFAGKSGFVGALTIPDTITKIGERAFANCSGLLGDLVIPDSVVEIGEKAFAECEGFKGKLVISKNVEIIRHATFLNCFGLSGDLIIPEKVRVIEKQAFNWCKGLSGSLVIPEGVTSIGEWAFYRCSGLKGDLILPNSIENVGAYAFYECEGFDGEIKLSGSLKTIKASAFSGCKGLKGDLVIPNNVIEIESGAFGGDSSLDGKMIIPEGVSTIGDGAFGSCKKLTGDLLIPDSVTKIGDRAFSDCEKLTGDLTIPDSVLFIGDGAFRGCKGFNGSLTLPKNITSIEDLTFFDCEGLSGDLVIPTNVSYIGFGAFSGDKGFKRLVLPVGLEVIEGSAFCACSGLTGDLVIPEGVTRIGEQAFRACGYTGKLVLPSSLITIEDDAFWETELTGALTLPTNLVTIGQYAFENCKFSGTLKLNNKLESIGSFAFGDSMFSGELILPDGIKEIGYNAFGESKFSGDLLVIPGSLRVIEDYTFFHCDYTGTLIMQYGVTEIGNAAICFYPHHFDDIYLPSSISKINENWGPMEYNTDLHCVPGSYAYDWGIEHGFTVIPWDDGSGSFDPSKPITSIELKPSELELHVGDSSSIRIKTDTGIVPTDRTTVSNSDDAVASVDAKLDSGKLQITALSVGETEVKVLIDGIEASARIHVLKPAGDFTITYILNGGTNSPSNVTAFNKNNPAIKLYPATRNGYDFVGWYTTSNFTGKAIKSIPKNANKNYVLYAKWKAKSYKITYKSPIKCSNPNLKAYFADSVYVLLNAIAPGYAFQGWYTDEDYTHKIEEISAGTYGNITLYAKWKGATYTVRYDGNGASSGSAEDTIHYYKTGTQLLSDGGTLYRKGYHIANWNDKANGKGKKYALSSKVNTLSGKDGAVVTLYAQWAPNTYTVRYMENAGGDTTLSGTTKYTTHTYDKPSNIAKCGYKRKGYVFTGWNTEADGSGTSYGTSNKVSNLTDEDRGVVFLFAQWQPIKYQITFDKGNKAASGSMETITAYYDQAVTLPKNIFSRDGYEFGFWTTAKKYNGKNWYYQDQDSITPNLITKENDKLQLKPVWLYSVTLDPNGGNGEAKVIKLEENIARKLPANDYTKDGYKFLYWTTKPTGGKKYNDQASVKNIGSITLYAQYEEKTCNITFNKNGGTGTMKAQTLKYSAKLPTNSFTNGDLNFDGWNTKADGSGNAYGNEEPVGNIIEKEGSKVTLYAQWLRYNPEDYLKISADDAIAKIENRYNTVGNCGVMINGRYQCVGLSHWYLSELCNLPAGTHSPTYACDYSTTAPYEKIEAIPDNPNNPIVPQKGDILIYTGGISVNDPYRGYLRAGHVAIYEAKYEENDIAWIEIWEQNRSDIPDGSLCKSKISDIRDARGIGLKFWGVWRPKFRP